MNNKPLWQECIEAFGGYESAKKAVEVADTQGLKTFNVEAMRSHLLEYRREHGIFEVGDYIIDSLIGNSVIRYHCGYDHFDKHYVESFLKHATDLEIAAGHRLS